MRGQVFAAVAVEAEAGGALSFLLAEEDGAGCFSACF
jgi:hypothetical protein